MDRRHITHFLAVVDEGTISGAARSLRLSQPSVSHTIQELETELDCKLFTRGRGMSLTASGRALVGPCRTAIRALDAARWAIDEVSELQSGELDIGAVSNLTVDPLVKFVARYRAEHSGIKVRLRNAHSGARGFEGLARGDIELLLSEFPPAAAGYQAVPLGNRVPMVVLPPGTIFPDRPFRMEDLPGQQWIAGIFPGLSARHMLNMQLSNKGLPNVDAVIETVHRQQVVPLVLAGAGAAILAPAEAEDAELRGAVIRPFDAGLSTGHAFYHRSDDLSPAAKAFLVVVRDFVRTRENTPIEY